MVLRDGWDSMDGGGASVVTNGPAGIESSPVSTLIK